MIKKQTSKKNIHVRTGDTVRVISGRDRGKDGKILAVSLNEQKVLVQGVNFVSKHVKTKNQSDEGGIVRVESALYASKVQLVCKNCKKSVRVSRSVIDGVKKRVCKKCYNVI